jgi:hypothetical protein
MGGGVVRKRNLCYIMKRIGGGYGMIGRCLSLFGLDGFGCFYYGNHAMFTRTALAITRSGLVWSGSGPVSVWQETGEVRGWFKYIQVGWWELVHSLPGCFLRDDSGDE